MLTMVFCMVNKMWPVHKQAKDAGQDTSITFTILFFNVLTFVSMKEVLIYHYGYHKPQLWADVNLGIFVNSMSTRNTKKFSLLSFKLRQVFCRKKCFYTITVTRYSWHLRRKGSPYRNKQLQQDKKTNFFIFCQAYPKPVAISAYIA